MACSGLQFDDMSNDKSTLPRSVEKTKGLTGLKTLKTKITGAILNSSLYEGGRKTVILLNHDQFENGSNKVITLIYNLLQIFLKDHNFLPRKLVITSDNCWRENKNQFVLSFLYSLVDIGIFEEISFVFLHVGHTGFAPDQMFSILAQEFRKTNIRTVEELMCLIRNSAIKPKPLVEKLEYIYEWKAHIQSQMAAPLKNHTGPKAFTFMKENQQTKMKYKYLPQGPEWLPKPGLKLLKDYPKYEPVGAAPFRLDKLEMDEVESSLRKKYFPSLPAQIRQSVVTSWQRLRRRLEQVEREYIPPMKLLDLPRSRNQPKDVFEFEYTEEEKIEVQGEMYPEKNGDVKEEEDIAVYTNEKEGRPWVGRIVKVYEREVIIHWFKKKKRLYTYESLKNQDGSPMTDRIPRDSIMYRSVSSVSKDASFQITPSWLNKILDEYNRLDKKV